MFNSIGESRMKKIIEKGRGQAYMTNYLPWYAVRDIGSWGCSNRFTIGRMHHFLSELELAYRFRFTHGN